VDQPRQACAGDEGKEERQWNEAIPNFADEERRKAGVSALGKGCPTRQILTTPQVGLPREEEVVEVPLFAASRVAPVFAQLVVAEAFEGFALATRLLKDFLLLVPQILPAYELALRIEALLAKRCLAAERETYLSGSCAHFQIMSSTDLLLPYPLVDLIKNMPYSGNLLVDGAQAQLLLMFDALPEMKHCLQWEMKGHGVSSAGPTAWQCCRRGIRLRRVSASGNDAARG
jgi:hypothetical protein